MTSHKCPHDYQPIEQCQHPDCQPQDPGPDWAAQRAKEIMSASYKGQGVGWSPADIQEHLAHALAAERDRALEDSAKVAEAYWKGVKNVYARHAGRAVETRIRALK